MGNPTEFPITNTDDILINLTTVSKETGVGDLMKAELVLRYIYLVIGMFGIFGNAVVVFIITKSPEMKKFLANQIILSQSVADALVGASLILTSFIRDVTMIPS